MTPSYGAAVTGIPEQVIADIDRLLAAATTGPVALTEAVADTDPRRMPQLVRALTQHVNQLHAARPREAAYRAAAVTARAERDQIREGGNPR